VLTAGTWPQADAADTVLLDYDRRHRRRIVLRGEAGLDFLVDLPKATHLRDGDGLALEDGRVIRVRSAPEPLLEIHGHEDGEMIRIAWHLGNRHLPVQLLDDRIRIRTDHVIADMVEGLGGHVEPVEAPFDPEPGAYAGAAGPAHHGHDHAHEHDHDQDHDHHGHDHHGHDHHGHDHHGHDHH
jgi:urease accessory protein